MEIFEVLKEHWLITLIVGFALAGIFNYHFTRHIPQDMYDDVDNY